MFSSGDFAVIDLMIWFDYLIWGFEFSLADLSFIGRFDFWFGFCFLSSLFEIGAGFIMMLQCIDSAKNVPCHTQSRGDIGMVVSNDRQDVSWECGSRRLRICSFRACALETLWKPKIVCSWTLLVRGEGIAPEITVTKSARFDELDSIYLVVFCWYNTTH